MLNGVFWQARAVLVRGVEGAAGYGEQLGAAKALLDAQVRKATQILAGA